MTELVIAALALQSPATFAETRGLAPLPRKDAARKYDLETDVPARNTIIEFNEIEGAVSYQVEIRPHSRYWAHNYKFDLEGKEPKLKIRLNPGQYALRTRSFDSNGYYGPWSGWQKFWIHYDTVKDPFPAANSVVKPKSGLREMVQFEWPIDPRAVGYRFILRDKDGNIIRQDNVRAPWTMVELELATKYSWVYVPILKESDFRKPKVEPPEGDIIYMDFRVAGSAPGTRDMQVAATASTRAVKYQFEFLKLDRVGERGGSSVFESPTPELKIAVAPGTYEARVRTYFNDNSISDWSPPWRFFVPFDPIKPIAPKNGYLLDPIDFEAPVTLSWQPQGDVNHYVAYIYDEKGDFVKKYTTEETKIDITLEHDNSYHWLVMPYSVGQSEIKPPEMPDYAYKIKVGKYIPLKLSASEEPSHIYGWGRYYTSMIDYQGRNYDLNSKVEQPIYGGSGELAFGYWHRKTHLGLLVHGSLSGFAIGNTLYNYGAAGTHVGYRYFLPNGDRLRLYVGYSYTEFPEFLRDPFIQNYDYHRVKSAGPQAQISYMGDFTRWPKYGYHTYATIYQNSKGIETPNGLDQIPQLSFTLGAFGTYKWSDDQKWMVGYAYRQENIRYKSSDRTGLDNYSTTTGHYLNLSIEFGLAKQKYK